MQQQQHYSRAPITEAVIDIEAQLPPDPVLPRRSDRVRMRAQFKGRKKPQPYFIDEE